VQAGENNTLVYEIPTSQMRTNDTAAIENQLQNSIQAIGSGDD